MKDRSSVSNMLQKFKFGIKKVLVNIFFCSKRSIKLVGVTNSSMIGYVGAEVKFRWLERGALVSIIQNNIRKCEQGVVLSQILDIKIGLNSVVLFTNNSRYEFHKCR